MDTNSNIQILLIAIKSKIFVVLNLVNLLQKHNFAALFFLSFKVVFLFFYSQKKRRVFYNHQRIGRHKNCANGRTQNHPHAYNTPAASGMAATSPVLMAAFGDVSLSLCLLIHRAERCLRNWLLRKNSACMLSKMQKFGELIILLFFFK